MEYIGFSVYYKNFLIYQNKKNDYIFGAQENEMAEEN